MEQTTLNDLRREAGAMDFALSEEQRAWHDSAVEFARNELVDDLAARDARREFWREGWNRCARFGLQGLTVPEAFGGQGQGVPEAVAAAEGLGYGCPDTGLIFAVGAATWTVTAPILQVGTEAQKQRWLPGLCDGSIVGANGASEPEAGSDIFSLTTRAERRGAGWVLNGRKTWITCGPVADLFVCYASTDPDRGILGLSAFLIPRDAPGVQIVREIPKMGLRATPMGEMVLEACELPADALLGRQGRGAELFNASMELERGAILAGVLGTMRRQLDLCIDHARKRRQFGKPIGKFQSVSNRIVDMKLRLETCRHLVYKFAWLKSRGADASLEAAMAKLHVSECFVQNSLDAVRTFGAQGFTTDLEIERDLRDSVGGLIFSGTNDIQRAIIAQRLRL